LERLVAMFDNLWVVYGIGIPVLLGLIGLLLYMRNKKQSDD
jgi:hypothetical protein